MGHHVDGPAAETTHKPSRSCESPHRRLPWDTASAAIAASRLSRGSTLASFRGA